MTVYSYQYIFDSNILRTVIKEKENEKIDRKKRVKEGEEGKEKNKKEKLKGGRRKKRRKMRKGLMKRRIINGGYRENGWVSVTDRAVKTDGATMIIHNQLCSVLQS